MLRNKDHNAIEQIMQVTDRCIQTLLDTGKPVIFSKWISKELGTDSSALNEIVLSFFGKTLDSFILSRIIEKVKELLVYTDQSLSKIARDFGYNNPAFLSAQLKKHSGFSASYYKQIRCDKQTIIQNYLKQNSR